MIKSSTSPRRICNPLHYHSIKVVPVNPFVGCDLNLSDIIAGSVEDLIKTPFTWSEKAEKFKFDLGGVEPSTEDIPEKSILN